MKMPTWEELGLIERSRCERLARHLRRLLAKADDCGYGSTDYIDGDDIHATMRLLEELLPGCDFAREREYYPPCDECHGWYWDNTCLRCHGTGYEERTIQADSAWATLDVRCPQCRGTGRQDCSRCHGTGLLIPESKEEGR